MRLIEAEKVEQAIKDYWRAQVDKALTLTDGNEKRINIYLEHNHELLKAIDKLPSIQPDTTTHDSIPAETGENDGDRTSGDCISRQKAFEYFVALWECIGTIMDRDEWEDACITTANEIPSAQPAQSYTIHSDGRLWVTVDDIDKVNAVVVDESKSKFCKQFYIDAQPEPYQGVKR